MFFQNNHTQMLKLQIHFHLEQASLVFYTRPTCKLSTFTFHQVEALRRKEKKPMSAMAAGRVAKYDRPKTIPVSEYQA